MSKVILVRPEVANEYAADGSAYTAGCPGCTAAADAEDAIEEAAIVQMLRSRLRPWRLDNLCRRYLHHWWRWLEPGVGRCRVCRSMMFTADAPDEAFMRHLGGSE